MQYVDGFVLPVPQKKLKLYRSIAQKAGKIWREHGALQYVEAVGEDLEVKFGMSFPKALKPKPGETIVFSWIVYKSRAHRDKVNAKVMSDPLEKTELCTWNFVLGTLYLENSVLFLVLVLISRVFV